MLTPSLSYRATLFHTRGMTCSARTRANAFTIFFVLSFFVRRGWDTHTKVKHSKMIENQRREKGKTTRWWFETDFGKVDIFTFIAYVYLWFNEIQHSNRTCATDSTGSVSLSTCIRLSISISCSLSCSRPSIVSPARLLFTLIVQFVAKLAMSLTMTAWRNKVFSFPSKITTGHACPSKIELIEKVKL